MNGFLIHGRILSGWRTLDHRQRILEQRELASKAVTAFLPTFQQVFNEHLKDSPMGDLSGFVVSRLIDVDVTQLPPNPSIGTAVRVSAKVWGTVTETTRHYPEPYRGSHLEESRVKPLEVGFTANATYEGDSYKVLDVYSMTFGTSVGTFPTGVPEETPWIGVTRPRRLH